MKGFKRAFCLTLALALAGHSGLARSQEAMPSPSASSLSDSDVQRIMANLCPEMQNPPSNTQAPQPPAPPLQGKESAPAAATMPAEWSNGIWLMPPQKGFTMHTGMWVQFDACIFWR